MTARSHRAYNAVRCGRAAARGTAARLGPWVSAVEQVPELTADGEWEGKGASYTDALAALRVCGHNREPAPTNGVVVCAQRPPAATVAAATTTARPWGS